MYDVSSKMVVPPDEMDILEVTPGTVCKARQHLVEAITRLKCWKQVSQMMHVQWEYVCGCQVCCQEQKTKGELIKPVNLHKLAQTVNE